EYAATKAQEPDGGQPRKPRRSRRATAPVTAPTARETGARQTAATPSTKEPGSPEQDAASEAHQDAANKPHQGATSTNQPGQEHQAATTPSDTNSAAGSLDVFAAFGVQRDDSANQATDNAGADV